MLTHDEIIRAVRRIRYSPKRARNGRSSPSVHALAAAAGITRQTVYNAAATGRMSPETAAALAHALDLSKTGLN